MGSSFEAVSEVRIRRHSSHTRPICPILCAASRVPACVPWPQARLCASRRAPAAAARPPASPASPPLPSPPSLPLQAPARALHVPSRGAAWALAAGGSRWWLGCVPSAAPRGAGAASAGLGPGRRSPTVTPGPGLAAGTPPHRPCSRSPHPLVGCYAISVGSELPCMVGDAPRKICPLKHVSMSIATCLCSWNTGGSDFQDLHFRRYPHGGRTA